jgi:predicted membrane protein
MDPSSPSPASTPAPETLLNVVQGLGLYIIIFESVFIALLLCMFVIFITCAIVYFRKSRKEILRAMESLKINYQKHDIDTPVVDQWQQDQSYSQSFSEPMHYPIKWRKGEVIGTGGS